MPAKRVSKGSAESASAAPLAHRLLLAHPGDFHPFRDGRLLARIGGQATIDRVVDAFYDRVGADPGFGPLFARDLAAERARQKEFLGEWLGGERRYSPNANAGLGHRHEALEITPKLAALWLGHFRAALELSLDDAKARAAILARLGTLAAALVNADAVVRSSTIHGMCLPSRHPAVVAAGLAQRGQVAPLRRLLRDEASVLARRSYAARSLHAAALAGKTEAARCLLDAGVDANAPCAMPVAVAGPALWGVLFVTPLCAARFKRRAETATLLVERGAVDDVFTAAFLGDADSLERQLDAHPELAEAPDPAADALDIVPLLHAVAGRHEAAVALLLGRVEGRPRALDHALRSAADHGELAIAELLVARGAEARGMGPGRWVLDERLAPLLARAGASAGGSGFWIRLSCTGNQGRKDDPDFVRALLRHGARVDDRQAGATALHFAAKAGFVRTIAALLEHGADPTARDAEGRTPAEWLERSVKSVDRAAVRRALTR